MYIRTWWVTLRNVTLRNVTRNVVTYTIHLSMHIYTIGIGHMCITQSDTFRYARLRILIVNDSEAGPSQLGYCSTNSFSYMCHVRAPHLHAYAYMTRAHSLHTGARQRCACVVRIHTNHLHALACIDMHKDTNTNETSSVVSTPKCPMMGTLDNEPFCSEPCRAVDDVSE